MKIKQYIKRILVFSLAFILGVVAVIKTAQFQESKTVEMYSLIQSIQAPQFESNSDPELTVLKEKLGKLYKNLYKNRCRVDFEECSYSGISICEYQHLLENQYIEFLTDLIESKKKDFNEERDKAAELRLMSLEFEIRKVKNEIEKFDIDVKAGKIDRKNGGRSLKYFEKCIQK